MAQRKLVLEFTKMSGAGNDFIVIDNRFYQFAHKELVHLARRWCARRTGVGADGLLAFEEPEEAGYHYRMRYLNPDGSVGTMCGNGARCLARYAQSAGLVAEELLFESDAGVYRARVSADPGGSVRLYVPPPQRYQPNIQLEGGLANEAGLGPWHYIWPGVEHVVCFVEEVKSAPVEEVGRAVRQDAALAPAGANVNFVQVNESGSLQVRTYEKGVEAETMACGTGALAAGIVAGLLGKTQALPVNVQMPGGVLTVGYQREEDALTEVYLEGPAVSVFRGTLDVDPSNL